jgi:hypothetical protein
LCFFLLRIANFNNRYPAGDSQDDECAADLGDRNGFVEEEQISEECVQEAHVADEGNEARGIILEGDCLAINGAEVEETAQGNSFVLVS